MENSGDSAQQSSITHGSNFVVVGLGASGGGVEAVAELFKYLPSDVGIAFIYIQHLASKQESMLVEILSRSTKMKVQTAQDNVRVQPNNVYVTPPATIVTLENGHLRLKSKSESFHYPIDSFLTSLAQECKTRSVGVVLSGTGSDGTQGLRAIYAMGGVTIVQQVDSARYRDMPANALNQGIVHFALTPENIAKKLVSIGKLPYASREGLIEQVKEEKEYRTITTLLKLKFGVDFSKYKESTIKRRISRRMLICKVKTLVDYINVVKSNPHELQALHDDMLIGVTNFFREPETYKILSEKILPELIKKTAEETIRVWVPGCATGEEVYSVAICILEALEKETRANHVQVFGTDINQKYIEKAAEGIYAENISVHVSDDRLSKFFYKTNGSYQVNKLIRDVCVFSKHDIIKDAPFSNLDLIFCRNVLIYLKADAQEKILKLFHCGLKKTGFLVLGCSESVGSAERLFNRKEDSVYAKREA